MTVDRFYFLEGVIYYFDRLRGVGLGGLIHYVCMNNKCTVNDSPRYHVLLEIHMYMYIRRGLGAIRIK